MTPTDPQIQRPRPRYDETYIEVATRFFETAPEIFAFLDKDFGYKKESFSIRDPEYIYGL